MSEEVRRCVCVWKGEGGFIRWGRWGEVTRWRKEKRTRRETVCGGVIGCMAYAQQLPTSGFKESLTLCEEGEGREGCGAAF